jgi:ribosomal protein L40E
MSAFGGDDVDTLSLMFDKLQYIFRGYDSYIQAFTEMHALYKQDKLSEREYYHGMTDAVLKYSALEFLGLKTMFEIKKALNRMNNPSSTHASILGLASGGLGAPSGTQNSISSFISAKSLPGRDDVAQKTLRNEKHCTSCGNMVPIETKFCRNCGNKF